MPPPPVEPVGMPIGPVGIPVGTLTGNVGVGGKTELLKGRSVFEAVARVTAAVRMVTTVNFILFVVG